MKLEDIKVGQYVRFEDKRDITYIRKIREIPQDNRYASIYLDKEANYSKGLSLKNIIKASFNIIDLIEVGDYVNGAKVNRLKKVYIVIHEIWSGREYLSNEEIKTIVTKEQFEQMSYKVGE